MPQQHRQTHAASCKLCWPLAWPSSRWNRARSRACCEVTLPEELQQFAARLHLALPSTNERLMIIIRVVREWTSANPNNPVHLEPEVLARLIRLPRCASGPPAERYRPTEPSHLIRLPIMLIPPPMWR
jgi:hypothetical protein